MQRYGQKNIKIPQKWGFPPFVTPQDFFSKIGLCHFCTLLLWCSNFMQKIRKKQWTVSEIFKDGRTHGWTDRQGQLRPLWINLGYKNGGVFPLFSWSTIWKIEVLSFLYPSGGLTSWKQLGLSNKWRYSKRKARLTTKRQIIVIITWCKPMV